MKVNSSCCSTVQAISLDAQLGTAPVATLGVVADLVVSAHAEPVGQGAVLLLLLSELTLDDERLVGRLHEAWIRKRVR